MLDDQLYGLIGLAKELGIPFSALLDMSLTDVALWRAFFARRDAERDVARRSRRR